MKKPIIGITGSFLIDTSLDFSGYRRSYVNEDYVNSVIKNGGIPIIIPMNNNLDVIKNQVNILDGIIFSGGYDVTPTLYGEEPLLKLNETSIQRDKFEFSLLQFTKQKNIPILGICRGLQLINVFHGGDLFQDLSYSNSFIKHDQVKNPTLKTHKVFIEQGSFLEDIFGKETMVNSFHHQIIKNIAKNFKPIAKSKDDVIEAIECLDYDFMVAVQWHPEMLHHSDEKMNLIFKKLIEKASI